MNPIVQMIERAFRRIFGKEPGDGLKYFIKDIGHLGIAELIVTIFSIPVIIFGGRYLGPEQFGLVGIIRGIGQIGWVFLLLGTSVALERYIAAEDARRGEYIGSGLILSCISISIVLLCFWFLKSTLQSVLQIDNNIFFWSIGLAFAFAIRTIGVVLLRAVRSYRVLVYISSVMAVVPLGVFIYWIVILKQNTFHAIIVGQIAFLVGTGAIGIFLILKKYYKGLSITKGALSNLLSYSNFAVISSICNALIVYLDRIFLNVFGSLSSVGIYFAYTAAADMIAVKTFRLVFNALFPAASREKNSLSILKYLNKVLIFSAVPIAVGVTGLVLLIVSLFGSEYVLDVRLALFMGIKIVLFVAYESYMWVFNAQGIEGQKHTVRIMLINLAMSILLFALFIPRFGMYGAVGTTILINLIFLTYYVLQSRRMIISRQV